MASMTEYALLLGLSLMVFTAMCTGFNSFRNTASSDARTASASMISAYVSSCISDMVGPEVSEIIVKEVELPEFVNGKTYIITPSPDGRNIIIKINDAHGLYEYMAPLLLRADGVTITGFIVSTPPGHTITYDSRSGTVILS